MLDSQAHAFEMEVLSALSTVISTLDVVIRTIKELYEARERQVGLASVLATHKQELYNIRQILIVISQEKVLQVVEVVEHLEDLEYHGRRLNRLLQGLGKERGQIKQYAHQLLNGQKSLDELAVVMASIGNVKMDLTLKMQVVHVGLTRSLGDAILVNCEMVEELDEKLQHLFGLGRGLKLAALLQTRKRRHDGTVRLSDSDLASLSDVDSTLVDEDEEGLRKGETSRIVKYNEATDDAMQLNAPIGIGGYVEVDHLVITNNSAKKTAFQVNHAVSQDNFDKILAARMKRG